MPDPNACLEGHRYTGSGQTHVWGSPAAETEGRVQHPRTISSLTSMTAFFPTADSVGWLIIWAHINQKRQPNPCIVISSGKKYNYRDPYFFPSLVNIPSLYHVYIYACSMLILIILSLQLLLTFMRLRAGFWVLTSQSTQIINIHMSVPALSDSSFYITMWSELTGG